MLSDEQVDDAKSKLYKLVYLKTESELVDELCKQAKSANAMRAALETIASLNDVSASAYLQKTGSYGAFDEPGSVEIARAALKSS